MGCVVKARSIGMIHTEDQDGNDMKVICVPIDKVDPRRSHVNSIDDINPHIKEELLLHFKEYKKLEKTKYDKVVIGGFKTIDETYRLIDEAIETFHNKH